MEKAGSSTAGVKTLRGARALMCVQVLILFSLSCEYLSDGLDVFLSRFGQNMLVMLAAIAAFNLEYFTLSVAYLIPSISVSICALVLALIALSRYKNQEAKSWVVFGIVLTVATSLLVFGSAVPFF